MDVRSADPSDVDLLAGIWYDGWQEAHAGILPPDLARRRTLDSFRGRLRAALPSLRVAGPPGAPVGFCLVRDDELSQLYVSAAARGSGSAAALIADAESRMRGAGVETAWLACAVGNERAARFYQKHGWRRTGTVMHEPDDSGGNVFEVWRYEKRLVPAARADKPSDAAIQIGIDLGGTKIEAIALAAGTIVTARRRVTTPRNYPGTLDAIARLVADLESDTAGPGPVGVGIPGVVSHATGLVKNANSTWLIGRPLQADLETRLARPVRVANDANCFTLSEAIDGAGQGVETVFGVILGTGVGGGIAIRQRIHEGPNQIAGEWGHSPLPWMTDEERSAAPRCYCGKYGCVETFLSGPGFELDYARLSGAQRPSQDIVRAAAAGDPHAVQALERYQDRLARGLAAVINLLDPDAIVLGGGMSNLPDLPSAVFALLPRYVFSDTVLTKVVLHVHGDSSGVRGAAWLWPA